MRIIHKHPLFLILGFAIFFAYYPQTSIVSNSRVCNFFWTPLWLPLGGLIRQENMDVIGIYRDEDANLDVVNRSTVCPERMFYTVTPIVSSSNLQNIYNSKPNDFITSSQDDPLIPPYAQPRSIAGNKNAVLMTVPLTEGLSTVSCGIVPVLSTVDSSLLLGEVKSTAPIIGKTHAAKHTKVSVGTR